MMHVFVSFLLSADYISRWLDLGDKLGRFVEVGGGDDPVRRVDIDQAIREMEENIQCRICFVRAFCIVLMPCGHPLCEECMEQVFRGRPPVCCPFCRQCVVDALQVYRAHEGPPIDVDPVNID